MLLALSPRCDGTDFYVFRSCEPGRRRLRDVHRQLHPAAGWLRRPELLRETYNISLATSTGEQPVTMAGSGAQFFDKPIDNVGMKSIPDCESYAQQHVYTISIPGRTGTGRVFVGQRKDSFVVNLGQTCDLVNIAKPATEFDPNAEKLGKDDLDDRNVTTIALEVPIACVATAASPIIGAWTTAAVRQMKTFNASPSSTPIRARAPRATSSRCRSSPPGSSTSS